MCSTVGIIHICQHLSPSSHAPGSPNTTHAAIHAISITLMHVAAQTWSLDMPSRFQHRLTSLLLSLHMLRPTRCKYCRAAVRHSPQARKQFDLVATAEANHVAVLQGNSYAQQAPVVAQGPACLLERPSPVSKAAASLGGHVASSKQLQRRVSQIPGLSRTSSADPSTFVPLSVTPEVERFLKVGMLHCCKAPLAAQW